MSRSRFPCSPDRISQNPCSRPVHRWLHRPAPAFPAIALGAELGLPEKFLIKPPSDGLTGLTDEDNLGFTYHAVNEYVRKGVVDPAVKEKIDRLHRTSRFKFQLMPVYHNGLPMALTDETDYYK